MFEITRDDIAALNDVDLRTLIGLLCEAELRRVNLPISAVTWGGSQTAKDGGLDVRVSLPSGTVVTGFIPRAATGFQVKKPDMPASEITKEMRPGGDLRSVIAELAAAEGAYIIVSSTGSTDVWPHPQLRVLNKIAPTPRLALPWVAPSLPWWELQGPWSVAGAAKMDMVPGMVTYFWITPIRTGTFDVLCAELCGIAHATLQPEDWADIALKIADRYGPPADADFEEQFSTLRRNILEQAAAEVDIMAR
jgi:hypothetical protein